MKAHKRDIRLYNNAGIRFPLCYANAERLDLDKTRLQVEHDNAKVTCDRCLTLIATGHDR